MVPLPEAVEPLTPQVKTGSLVQAETRKRPRAETDMASPQRYGRSPSRSRSRSPRSRGPRSPDRETPRSGGREDNVGSIFVGNLPADLSDRRLREFFSEYGTILSVKLVYNPETGKPKGFGFVKFEDPRDAEDAIDQANGKSLDGRALKVNTARYGGNSGRGRGDFHFNNRGGFRGDFRGGYRGGRGRGSGRDYRIEYRNGNGYNNERPYSPGRYAGERYSPDRYSPDPADEPRRHRSASPHRGRDRSPGGASKPARAEKPHSSSSGSSDTESKQTDQILDGPPTTGDIKRRRQQNGGAVPAPEDPALKKEVEVLHRREEELTARLAAVEAELTTARSSKADLLAQVAELKRSVQRSEEAAAQFKKWLKALSDHSRNLLGAKAALAAAETTAKGYEEDLSIFLEEADTFLLADKPRKKRRHLKNEEATNAAEDVVMEGQAEGEAKPQAEDVLLLEEPPAEEQEGAQDVAANFKPGIKFKLAAP